jgi:ABC-type transport system involved in multi-copper enzyme maturation permease subunit
MWPFLKITLLGGWRANSTRTVFLMTLAAIGVAWLAGSFSPRQPQTVAFDVGFSLIRILSVLLVLFWVQELVSKEIERKTVIWACANPVSRGQYVLAKFMALALLAAVALLLMGGMSALSLLAVAPKYAQSTPPAVGGVWLTFIFLWFDLLVILAFGLLMAVVSTTILLPFFLGLAFAIVTRSLGPTIAYSTASDSSASAWAPVVQLLQWVLPDLSRYDIRAVVLYGQWPEQTLMYGAPVQALAYVALLMTIAALAFSRREFE